MLQQVKAQYPSDAAYQAALKKYSVSQQDVENHLLAGVRALRFAALRFRPEVQLSDQDLHAAYDKSVADSRTLRLAAAATRLSTLSRASLERAAHQSAHHAGLLDQWLETARMEKHVDYREAAFQ